MSEHTASCGCMFDAEWWTLRHCDTWVDLNREQTLAREQHIAQAVAGIVRAEQAAPVTEGVRVEPEFPLIPPSETFTINAEVRMMGEGKPLPYPDEPLTAPPADRDAAYLAWAREYYRNSDVGRNWDDSKLMTGFDYDSWCAAWEARGQQPDILQSYTDGFNDAVHRMEEWLERGRRMTGG